MKSNNKKSLYTKIWIFLLSFIFIFNGCKTTSLEPENEIEKLSDKEFLKDDNTSEAELKEYYLQNELKVQDVEDTVVFVDRPVYVPFSENSDINSKNERITGKDAVINSAKVNTVKPEQYKEGTFYYQYNENLVYEVYAEPYHLTDIILETGEVVIGNPLISEDEAVWELTAGVAKDFHTGQDIQHLFIKPAYSALDSSMIIITDRRVYHLRIKSYKDIHMAMVKFTYPQKRNVWATNGNSTNDNSVSDYIRITNPEYLSFDYKITYSMIKKPEFLPKRVYDDGQSTYIQVDDIVLQKKLPVLFNEDNEIINFTVKKNIFVINRLINKVTLKLGNEKVVIQKKKTEKQESVSE